MKLNWKLRRIINKIVIIKQLTGSPLLPVSPLEPAGPGSP